MPKGPSPYPKSETDPDTNFGIEKTVVDAAGNVLRQTKTVKPRKKKGTPKDAPPPPPENRNVPQTIRVPMKDTSFSRVLPNGSVETVHQSLYHPPDTCYPLPGRFKGMATILWEHGLINEANLRAECKGFNCLPGATACCCRRALFNQPDFLAEKSILENTCEVRGFRVLFLPKFHCELNFIEQCWGAAKRYYRMLPPSSKEEDLETNVKEALDSVSLETMRQYVIFRHF